MIETQNFELLPGLGLGPLRLGMPRHEALALIGADYSAPGDPPGLIVQPPLRLWFEGSPQYLNQIMVEEGFRGHIFRDILVGMSLGEIAERLGRWREIGDAYVFETAPFTCFEPRDDDDDDDDDDDVEENYDELETPMRRISVFGPGPGRPPGGQWQEYFNSLPERLPIRISVK